jgi:hypothetical protein
VQPSTPTYRLALPQTHKRAHSITVRTMAGEVLARDLPIGQGTVSAQLTSRVSRVAEFTVDASWFPESPDDILSPYHAVVEIEAGIGYPSGEQEMFPVFVGRVVDARLDPSGEVTIRADDLAADVVNADFETPYALGRGPSAVAAMEAVILDGFPEAVFGTHDVTDAPVPDLAWDSDRGKALDDLASIMGARWYTLGDGSFVFRAYAYDDVTPVIRIFDGPAGILSTADISLTSDGTHNSVVVVSERPDGGAPVRAVVRDLDPSSPTFYAGPFGRRVLNVTAPTALTTAEAQRIAAATLNASRALTSQWALTCSPDMTLEPGDVVDLEFRDRRSVQVIDAITYPLGAREAQDIRTRSAVAADASL